MSFDVDPWSPRPQLWPRVRPPGLSKRTVAVRTPNGEQAAAMRVVGMAIRCALMPVEVQRRS